jgi:DNA repair exonuclease SbcCD ATPase subunit
VCNPDIDFGVDSALPDKQQRRDEMENNMKRLEKEREELDDRIRRLKNAVPDAELERKRLDSRQKQELETRTEQMRDMWQDLESLKQKEQAMIEYFSKESRELKSPFESMVKLYVSCTLPFSDSDMLCAQETEEKLINCKKEREDAEKELEAESKKYKDREAESSKKNETIEKLKGFIREMEDDKAVKEKEGELGVRRYAASPRLMQHGRSVVLKSR